MPREERSFNPVNLSFFLILFVGLPLSLLVYFELPVALSVFTTVLIAIVYQLCVSRFSLTDVYISIGVLWCLVPSFFSISRRPSYSHRV